MRRAVCFLLTICLLAGAEAPVSAQSTRTYANKKLGFSFEYPSAYTMREVPDETDTSGRRFTLQFLRKGKIEQVLGFQLNSSSFEESTEAAGLAKSKEGWEDSYGSPADEISGRSWRGLSISSVTRCFGDNGYEGMGDVVKAFASSGSKTLWIDGGECDRLNDEALKWVVSSLRFPL